MRQRALRELAVRQIQRTRASKIDTYVGLLGELVWAKLRYGTIEAFDTLGTRGKVDDGEIEVKTSKTRISEQSHLMVREDYAQKRQPHYYVLVLIPNDEVHHNEHTAYVCGWATHDEVMSRPPLERVSNHTGKPQGYRCFEIRAGELHDIRELPMTMTGVK
jgi:hypothetical protein